MKKVIIVGSFLLIMAQFTTAQHTPRLRLDSARTMCDGVRCAVTYEYTENSGKWADITLYCSHVADCEGIVTYYAGWKTTQTFPFWINAGQMMQWRGVYPNQIAVYCDPAHCILPFKLEVEGVSAWVGWGTIGDVTTPLKPTEVEVLR